MQNLVPHKPITIWKKEESTDLTKTYLDYMPKKLLLSLSSKCNLSCKHCGRSHFENIPGKFMPKERIDSIISDFFPYVSAIQIGGNDLGEQMMSPYFEYFLKNVQKYNKVDLDMVSNGTLINKSNAPLIVDTFSKIILSAEGVGSSYEAIRGVKWNHFLKSLDTIFEAREKSNAKRKTLIVLQMCLIREFKNDYFKLLDLVKEKGFDFSLGRNFIPCVKEEEASSLFYYPDEHDLFLRELKSYAKSLDVVFDTPPYLTSTCDSEKVSKNNEINLESFIDSSIKPNISEAEKSGTEKKEEGSSNENKKNKIPVYKNCSLPFEVFGIQVDGKIIPCCETSFDLGFYVPGKDEIMKAWNQKNYITIRKTVNSGYPLNACRKCEVGLIK